jgi:hypothetical protein
MRGKVGTSGKMTWNTHWQYPNSTTLFKVKSKKMNDKILIVVMLTGDFLQLLYVSAPSNEGIFATLLEAPAAPQTVTVLNSLHK